LYQDGNEIILEGGFRIHADWHPKRRSERFPTVEERVKLYMSNWYYPTCENKTSGRFANSYKVHFSKTSKGISELWPRLEMTNPWDHTSEKIEVVDSIITPGSKFLLDRRVMEDCARSPQLVDSEGKLPSETRIRLRKNMRWYCHESIELLDTVEQFDLKEKTWTPLLASFGDSTGVFKQDLFDTPFFAKHRAGTTKENIDAVAWDVSGEEVSTCWRTSPKSLEIKYHRDEYHGRFSPIIWRLNSRRHWGSLEDAARQDTPWEHKKGLAMWRGVLTGRIKGDTDIEVCQGNTRCRFVLDHADSKFIDCGLTNRGEKLSDDVVNGTKVVKKWVDMTTIQKHKVIISLEGNDVSTGLKWNLLSESVVLMPPPTRTSWAMEELLQPWVHYVPMLPDGSNAEVMVQWILNNDKEARRITERATLFIYDLMYHPDADRDDHKVKKEIVRRYRDLWH
jgi:hypothetical protein